MDLDRQKFTPLPRLFRPNLPPYLIYFAVFSNSPLIKTTRLFETEE